MVRVAHEAHHDAFVVVAVADHTVPERVGQIVSLALHGAGLRDGVEEIGESAGVVLASGLVPVEHRLHALVHGALRDVEALVVEANGGAFGDVCAQGPELATHRESSAAGARAGFVGHEGPGAEREGEYIRADAKGAASFGGGGGRADLRFASRAPGESEEQYGVHGRGSFQSFAA